ncbi:hypothetical protein PanWU01x14_236630 [Parasponia andersonii]|uniref:Uncharacterized protein n=1 Tax=Parasponia andersonii TaxID=3476 RepID=A0A2P5BI55_PARAD|nr:hypothetical protein PanWU01x14_236630 [Parasponia andersonii]
MPDYTNNHNFPFFFLGTPTREELHHSRDQTKHLKMDLLELFLKKGSSLIVWRTVVVAALKNEDEVLNHVICCNSSLHIQIFLPVKSSRSLLYRSFHPPKTEKMKVRPEAKFAICYSLIFLLNDT